MQKVKTNSSNLEEQKNQETFVPDKEKRDKLAKQNAQMAKILKEAESKARANDIKNNTDPGAQFPNIDNDVLGEALQYFYANGYGLHKQKDYRLKYKFAQLLQNNWQFLNDHQYLTTEEKVFIIDLNPYVAMHSNCVVKDVNSKVQEPLNQAQIAKLLQKSTSQVSRIVKNLIMKGILAKADIPNKDGSKVVKGRSHTLYFNPNILFSGEKDRVNETLKTMFNNPPELLHHLPDQLFMLRKSAKKSSNDDLEGWVAQ